MGTNSKPTIVTAEKLLDLEFLKSVLEFCYDSIEKSTIDLPTLYRKDESIIRTQLFLIKLEDVPHKVAMHLRTHSACGQFWLMGSSRGDWNGVSGKEETVAHDITHHRLTPCNMLGILNAGHLIDMSRRRLCGTAEEATQDVMYQIKSAVSLVDIDLASYMVPDCEYRGGICTKGKKSCGHHIEVLKSMVQEIPERVYRSARNEKVLREQQKQQKPLVN